MERSKIITEKANNVNAQGYRGNGIIKTEYRNEENRIGALRVFSKINNFFDGRFSCHFLVESGLFRFWDIKIEDAS